MSDFDEWFKSLNEGGRTTYFLGQEGNISKEAWNHQQAKIDELQARIDKVVHILTYTNHASTPLCNELRDILKGNKDEK